MFNIRRRSSLAGVTIAAFAAALIPTAPAIAAPNHPQVSIESAVSTLKGATDHVVGVTVSLPRTTHSRHPRPVRVSWRTFPAVAGPGFDFVPAQGTVTLTGSSAQIGITIKGNTTPAANQQFVVELVSARGAKIEAPHSIAVVTVIDDSEPATNLTDPTYYLCDGTIFMLWTPAKGGSVTSYTANVTYHSTGVTTQVTSSGPIRFPLATNLNDLSVTLQANAPNWPYPAVPATSGGNYCDPTR